MKSSTDCVAQAPTRRPGKEVQEMSMVIRESIQDIADKENRGRTWLVGTLIARNMLQKGAYEFKGDFYETYEPTREDRSKLPEELVSR